MIRKRSIEILPQAFLMLCVLFFSSCDSKRIFEQNQALPESGWASSNIVKFNVDIKDPATATNFYINVRNADGYPYNNLFLFIKTTFPNGKMSNDTLECILADEKGKWIGSGIGDLYDNQIPFKKNVRFPLAGTYSFEIQQGMRTDNIPLIMDVGLRIEKAE
ncbi:MAG: gliding motility lipoprotein GldH [Bacteroidia bacterium]